MKRVSSTLLLLVVLSGSLKAQQLHEDISDDALLDLSLQDLLDIEIVSVSKKAEKISKSPANVLILTDQDIIDRGYANLKDIFHDLPGVEIVENFFSEFGSQVVVRGVQGNQKIIVLLNGMRTNPAGGESYPFRSDFSIRSIKRIEVIYGPSSTLYGQDGLNGLINVITKDETEKTSIEAQIIGGSNGHKEGMFSALVPIKSEGEVVGSVSGMVQFQYAELDDLSKVWSDWYDTNFSEVNINPERKDNGFNAYFRVKTKNSSVQLWHKESKRSSAEGGYGNVLYFVDEAVWRDRTTAAEFKNAIDFGAGSTLESIVSANRHEIDKESQYIFPVGPGVLSDFDFKYGIGQRIQLEERLSHTFSEKLSLLSGITLSSINVTPKSTIAYGADPDVDLNSQAGSIEYILPEQDTLSVQNISTVNFTQFGIYSELYYEPLDKLKLIAGVRVDQYSLFDDTPVSPRLSAIYEVNSDLAIKYIYTQAYVAPAPYFSYAVYFNGAALNTTNPDLKPETASSNELNVSYTNGDLIFSLSGYLNNQENLIQAGDFLYDANIIRDDIIVDENTVLLTQAANQGRRTIYGIDLYTRYKIGSFSFWGAYSYVDGELTIEETTFDLEKISRHNLKFGATYRYRDKLSATVSGRFGTTPVNIQEVYENAPGSDMINSELSNPYQLNLHLNYMPVESLRCFLNMRNLTNHLYATQGILSATPQDGMKITLGVSWTY